MSLPQPKIARTNDAAAKAAEGSNGSLVKRVLFDQGLGPLIGMFL